MNSARSDVPGGRGGICVRMVDGRAMMDYSRRGMRWLLFKNRIAQMISDVAETLDDWSKSLKRCPGCGARLYEDPPPGTACYRKENGSGVA